MRFTPQLSSTTLAALTLSLFSLGACSDSAVPGGDRLMAPAASHADQATGNNAALSFDGTTANASTPLGTVATTQIQNMVMDAMVKYAGTNATNTGQAIFYNGNGGVSGWGILVLGASDGEPDGTIAFLSGGITVVTTPLVLVPGKWQHLVVERSFGQRTTIALDDAVFDAGVIPVAGVGGAHAAVERTTIGGAGTFDAPSADFNGVIDDVNIVDLTSHATIESWSFNEGSGSTTTGTNGTVLTLGSTAWVANDDNAHASNGRRGLLFDGVDATTSTPAGTLITPQLNNLSLEMMVSFDGATANDRAQVLYYNGNGGHAGWGILLLGANDGQPTGTITILTGGHAVTNTGLVLPQHGRHYIRATRDAGENMTVTLDDATVDIGWQDANALTQGAPDQRTSVGGDGTFSQPSSEYNGSIWDLRLTDLGTLQTIEHWKFSEGSGAVTRGDNGTLLFLGNTQWAHHPPPIRNSPRVP